MNRSKIANILKPYGLGATQCYFFQTIMPTDGFKTLSLSRKAGASVASESSQPNDDCE